ncbi:MAG: hypothetical protein V4726_16360 [Verrucomicrobiota bacterium]
MKKTSGNGGGTRRTLSPGTLSAPLAGSLTARPATAPAKDGAWHALQTTSNGRGIFKTGSASANSRRRENPAPPAAAPISEEELQWRAARVEQEANHDLRRLVTLLDLDEEQQDRIFQTLARRSAEWHPLLQPAIIGPGGVVDTGKPPTDSSAGAAQPGEASPLPDSSPPPPSPASPEPPVLADGGDPFPPLETPLTDVLAPDLTAAQQEELAEDELDRQEWWESIIPRLLPGEDDTGDIYAVPPTANTSVEEPPSSTAPASE